MGGVARSTCSASSATCGRAEGVDRGAQQPAAACGGCRAEESRWCAGSLTSGGRSCNQLFAPSALPLPLPHCAKGRRRRERQQLACVHQGSRLYDVQVCRQACPLQQLMQARAVVLLLEWRR